LAQALTFQEELIIQLKAGDQKAFGTLYRSYSNAFLSIIKQIIHDDSELAKDILQDAMVKIWNNMAQYDASKGTLFTWTMNICRNVAIDKTRSKDFKNQAKNKSLDASPETGSRHSSIQPMPELIGVRKMLEVLDPNHREVVDVVYMLGYSHAEAAELLKIPVGTVKTRIRNAIIELRKRYQHL
jgi:RNA polymerase sigma factor (sigma-70 family)